MIYYEYKVRLLKKINFYFDIADDNGVYASVYQYLPYNTNIFRLYKLSFNFFFIDSKTIKIGKIIKKNVK